ncbi:hypothetical protein C4D60_Mb06t11420 [Musa balbisiana]|uniref:Uncharacterized protein n=1 Tax=Musa balbisiana TaxID=52838 RepID=A0A4S8IM99_MUSBA|nr:hypothetical protein C4D60_Mb06t11420 [Musa balbisiana]
MSSSRGATCTKTKVGKGVKGGGSPHACFGLTSMWADEGEAKVTVIVMLDSGPGVSNSNASVIG